MKLQRIVSRKVGDKTYYKWQLTLPQEEIERLGWRPGEELALEARAGALSIRRAERNG